ncbi:MAG TPA: dethiobiotin synthase, partial [Bacteroidales bacterium]|nr:dethiobiotin synthase [Bacteroidales bacterium]
QKRNKMAQIFFISGIDTDCGKTYITSLIARNMNTKPYSVITQKIVQTGCLAISNDIIEHRKAMGINLLPEDTDGTTCPYVFKFAASPHIASKIEGRTIEDSILYNSTTKLAQHYDTILIEGVGGLCVPLNDTMLVADYVAKHSFPLVLISSSKLGSINHTLLSLELCKQKNIAIHTLVYNIFPHADTTIAESSFQYISHYMHVNFPDTHICTNSDVEQGYSLL